MKISEILRRMLITRKCILCDEPIDYERENPFCDDCEKIWDEHYDVRCATCGNEISICSCLPPLVKKNFGNCFWCVFYNSGGKASYDSIIYSLKYERRRETILFCAGMMKKAIINGCKKHGIDYRDFVVTYAPRRKHSINKYMLDHSRELAKHLSKMLNLDFVEAISNIGEDEQKTLNKIERRENARKSYELKEGFVSEHRNYFLVDDIVTTGATLLYCSRLLYEAGAEKVIPITYAKDNYRKGDK